MEYSNYIQKVIKANWSLVTLVKKYSNVFPEIFYDENPPEGRCLSVVKEVGRLIGFIEHPTEEMNMAAVQEDWSSLRYIKNQTYPVCLEAVTQCGYALQYVKEQTLELCLMAVRNNPSADRYVNPEFKETCEKEIERRKYESGEMMDYMLFMRGGMELTDYVKEVLKNDRDLERLDRAYSGDFPAIFYNVNPSVDICFAAVKRQGMLIALIKNQTEDLCLEAVKQNGKALKYVKHQTLELCLAAVRNDPEAIELVNPEFKEVCEKEIERLKSKQSLKYADTSDPDLCKATIKQDSCKSMKLF